MKLEITREIKQKEIIDIEFPYYYTSEWGRDLVDVYGKAYGKIEENKCTLITETKCVAGISYEIEIDDRHASCFGCYMTEYYKSSEEEYLAAKGRLLKAAQEA